MRPDDIEKHLRDLLGHIIDDGEVDGGYCFEAVHTALLRIRTERVFRELIHENWTP